MRLSPSSYIYALITIIGLIRAIQLYYVSTRDLREANKKDNWYYPASKLPTEDLVNVALQNSTRIDDSPDKLFYFLQVSDLHISKFQPKGHTIHFLHFLQSALPVIKPEFVVVTGDLVDAKDETLTVSSQYPEEWQVYKSAVEQASNGTTWHDMRGNHDCFDMASWKSESNMYRTHGKSSSLLEEGKGVYDWQVSKPYGTYNFVAVDSCPKKGPSRPFNFFGYLTTNAMNRLVEKIMPVHYNHTFLFSHYPTTTLIPGRSSEGFTFSDLANHFSVYFCGHLHRLTAGLGDVRKSYSKKTDSLELELSDMKDHGSYRIVAVDHDLISFVDIDLPINEIPPVSAGRIVPLTEKNKIIWPKKLHPAPVVLVTNPKDSRYTIPTKEPLQSSHKSSHIRFLIFSEYEPDQLDIKIFMDEKPHLSPTKFVGDLNEKNYLPLWTSVWEPNDFDDYETHLLRIEVTSPDGQMGLHQVPFRMDNFRVKIQGGAGEWIIWSSIAKIARFLSIFATTAMLTTMIVPKIYNDYERCQSSYEEKHNLRNKILFRIHEIDLGLYRSIYSGAQKFIYTWIHRFLQFPEEQAAVWNVCFITLISLLCLPWFRAEFIPSGKDDLERMGLFYLWGLLFEADQWIPMADTWLYAIFTLTFDVGVFILFFVWKSTSLHLLVCKGVEKRSNQLLCDRSWFQLLVLLYWAWRLSKISDLATFYGGIWPTLVLNLLVWWLFFVAVVIIFGRSGIVANVTSRSKGSDSQPLGLSLDICPACHDSSDEPENHVFNNASQINISEGEEHDSITPPETETRFLLADAEGSDSSTSSTLRRSLRRNVSKKD